MCGEFPLAMTPKESCSAPVLLVLVLLVLLVLVLLLLLLQLAVLVVVVLVVVVAAVAAAPNRRCSRCLNQPARHLLGLNHGASLSTRQIWTVS